MPPMTLFSPYERIFIPSGTEILIDGRKHLCDGFHGTVLHVLAGYAEVVEGLLIVHPPELAVVFKRGQEGYILVTEELVSLNGK